MNQPSITKILEIAMLKDQIAKLYTELDQKLVDLKDEFGTGRFDYDLENLPMLEISKHFFAHQLKHDGQYFKFEITDNVLQLIEGKTVFQTTAIKPLSFSSMSLKRCPDALKGEQSCGG